MTLLLLTDVVSLCPLNASVPITGWAVIPVGQLQVENIPSIALSIPDIEGFAKIQIFANSTQTEIGCFQAVMRNGNSFSHPEAVSPVLALFTVVAIAASFATAAYGVSIQHMRTHYAHSLSVLIVFETFHSIFFSGALSLQWPSMLVAWWSNFACFAGMIYISPMIHSVSSFAGVSGNASQVGGAGSSVVDSGGGLAAQIYGRDLSSSWLKRAIPPIIRRDGYNASDPFDYTWAGHPVTPGLPLPGTWTGFAGDLASVGIPVKDAFIVGIVWFLVALALVALCVLAFKGTLEVLAGRKWIKEDRLVYFRSNYRRYLGQAVLRTIFIAFFMMTTLALIQVTVNGSVAATAIAAVVFALFVIGVGCLVAYACHVRLRFGRHVVEPDSIVFAPRKLFKVIPVLLPTRSSTLKKKQLSAKPAGSVSFFRINFIDDDPSRATVHQDQAYVTKFGWLSARYRRTRWWFFAYYVAYQIVRACFIGGGMRNPAAQVYGVFAVEIIAFVVITKLNPFEGARNTALAVWMLSISKVVTAGVSIAFLPAFNLDRIIATVLGVLIIIVQGFLVVALLILIALGAISSHMSLSRNREEYHPESLDPIRLRFFENLQTKAPDVPLPPKEKTKKAKSESKPEPQVPKEPYFSVNAVRRAPKIEDEAGDVLAEMGLSHQPSTVFPPHHSRPASISSRYSVGTLPRGARPHRASWNSKDFAQWDALMDRPDSGLANRVSTTPGTVMGGDAHAAKGSVSLAPLVVKPEASQESLRPQASQGSLRMPTSPTSRLHETPISPITTARPATPTLEMLARHADERAFDVLPPPPTR